MDEQKETVETENKYKMVPRDSFLFPKVDRICWQPEKVTGEKKEFRCPFSFEHTKLLIINACSFPKSEKEFMSVICQQCMTLMKMRKESLEIKPVSIMPPLQDFDGTLITPIPTASGEQESGHLYG